MPRPIHCIPAYEETISPNTTPATLSQTPNTNPSNHTYNSTPIYTKKSVILSTILYRKKKQQKAQATTTNPISLSLKGILIPPFFIPAVPLLLETSHARVNIHGSFSEIWMEKEMERLAISTLSSSPTKAT